MASEIPYYEYIVVGVGGIGSGTLYWLSKKAGKSVLGLEQFKLGHENGGSQDHSRIIRQSYDDPIYTKLCPHMHGPWEELEKESGIQVVYNPGSYTFGKKGTGGGTVVNRYAAGMAAHNIPFEMLDGRGLTARVPGMQCGDDTVAVFDKSGGIVDAGLANALHVQMARGRGASVIEQCAVNRVVTNDDDGTALVYTTKGTFKCRRLVVTCGAWVNQVLGSLGAYIPIMVTQEQVSYFATPNTRLFTKDRFPSYAYYGDDGLECIYGMGIHGNSGFKVGVDCGGPEVTANTRTFDPDLVREERARSFVREFFPEGEGPLLYTKTCLYTLTLDRRFVIDSLTRQGKPQVIVCCGAGHAYKWAALFGKILSQLATEGCTPYDISPFSLDRPAVQDPNFVPICRAASASLSKL